MDEPLKIFLSYAHADRGPVRKLHAFLKQQGCQPWLDAEDIIAGAEWLPEIQKAIRGSDLFVVCMSSRSIVRRGVLQIELKRAIDAAEQRLQDDLFIIPVWVQGGTSPPPDELPEVLARRQWVNLSDGNGHARLIKSIRYQAVRLQRRPPGEPAPAAAGPAPSDAQSANRAVEALRSALQTGEAGDVDSAMQALMQRLRQQPAAFTPTHGARALGMLARKGLLAQVQVLADTLLLGGIDSPAVRRGYAEALYRRGWYRGAADALDAADGAASDDGAERSLNAEVRGRLYTALFLERDESDGEGAADALRRALAAYETASQGDARSHLVRPARAAALAARAAALGIELPQPPDIAALCTLVLDEVQLRDDLAQALDIDELEAAVHASLGLGRADEAAAFLTRCCAHPGFERGAAEMLAAQLKALWNAPDAASPAHALWTQLQARMAQVPQAATADAAGGEASSAAALPTPRSLQAVLGTNAMPTWAWWKRGLECARAVARIRTAGGGTIATGFLLQGRSLHPSLPDEPVVLTTSYVVTDDAGVRESYGLSILTTAEAQVSFADDGAVYAVTQLWTSFSGHTTILRLLPGEAGLPPGLVTLQMAPDPGAIRNAYLIGHPLGRDLSFSASDSEVVETSDSVLRYRTPTEPGNSGSPVFDDEWRLCGIHTGKVPSSPGSLARLNQATRIDFVRRLIGGG